MNAKLLGKGQINIVFLHASTFIYIAIHILRIGYEL